MKICNIAVFKNASWQPCTARGLFLMCKCVVLSAFTNLLQVNKLLLHSLGWDGALSEV